MDKFLDMYGPPKLNKETVTNLNRFIRTNEIETII
jgi:hypothetical protein